MGADALMVVFVVFAVGFSVGCAVKGWICEARELRQYHRKGKA